MANTFVTNKKVDLVALRAAEAAQYLTVGSKSYFSDQLEGKRNGQSYEFVIRDAGEYATGMDMTGKVSNLQERKVTKDIKLGNIVIDTNLLEKVTDVEWEKEIAIPNGKKLINGVVKDVVDSDLGRQNVAFVGKGWLPISKASRFLGSISSEDRYAFIDPMIDSIMAAGGKSFTPVDAEPLYKTGLLGSAFGAEFRESQFMPTIEISEALATELASATVTSYTPGDQEDTMVLNGVTEVIPAGTPLFVQGVYACDLVGDKTSSLKAFIAIEDAQNGSVKVRHVDFTGNGTKEATVQPKANDKLVNSIEAGQYFTGIIRLDGAMEFDTLKKLDWSNAESTSNPVEGVTVHEGRAVDVITGSNKTRWTVASLAGIVEPRACAYICVKDATANLMVM